MERKELMKGFRVGYRNVFKYDCNFKKKVIILMYKPAHDRLYGAQNTNSIP